LARRKSDPTLKYWFTWGLTIAAFGMIKNQKDELQGKDAEPDLQEIGHACDGLAQVIIPIIRALHAGPRIETD